MRIDIPQATCQNTREALRREWLDTNGLGGYASSTLLHCHTRKYHGLLVANLAETGGRHVLLSKFEDSVLARQKEFFLSCHKYPGVFFPSGPQHFVEYAWDLCHRFVYRIGDVTVRKEVAMVADANITLVRYTIDRTEFPVFLHVKPLLAFRGFHELTRANADVQAQTDVIPNGFSIQPYDPLPTLCMQTNVPSRFYPAPAWYFNFEYCVEHERGYPYQEDLLVAGAFESLWNPAEPVIIAASVENPLTGIDALWDREMERRRALRPTGNLPPPELTAEKPIAPAAIRDHLAHVGRQFLVTTPSCRPTVLAGYHWFDDWGRDMFIALPGLTFSCGRHEEGKAILDAAARHERRGLIPNFFAPDETNNAYNTVDASLWFVWCVQQMLQYTGDRDAVRRLWPTVRSIVEHYRAGTDNGIVADEHGLLHAGSANTQLTWMDATAYGKPVTPRHGCAVEINALWYNALCFADQWAREERVTDFLCGDRIDPLREAFNRTFWIESGRYLGDVFTDGVLDEAVRPNQVFAASLPFSPLNPGRRADVVEKVRHELLTPFGLRTLSPGDRRYCGSYHGNHDTRDSTYHQGTVWPWLLGHYGEALLRDAPDRNAAAACLLDTIRPLLTDHLLDAGVGTLSEIFDGDPPHHPNGCIAQAWSVGEVLRLLTLLTAGKTGAHGESP